jgi:uncharacterized iron-regulated membrane protein
MSHQQRQADAITWIQLHNAVPIIGGILSLVGVFNFLSTKVELTSQRLEYTQQAVQANEARISSLENKVHEQDLSIQSRDSQRSVQGATVTPTIDLKASGLQNVLSPTPKK